jgi:hypothetical protein
MDNQPLPAVTFEGKLIEASPNTVKIKKGSTHISSKLKSEDKTDVLKI